MAISFQKNERGYQGAVDVALGNAPRPSFTYIALNARNGRCSNVSSSSAIIRGTITVTPCFLI
jgi:hypothetical protein